MSSSSDPIQNSFDSYEPKQELESPFLNEEFLADEARIAQWRVPVPGVQIESPFLEAFEEGWRSGEVEEFEEFLDELDEEEFEEEAIADYPNHEVEGIPNEGFSEFLDGSDEEEFEGEAGWFEVNDFSKTDTETHNDKMSWEMEEDTEGFFNEEAEEELNYYQEFSFESEEESEYEEQQLNASQGKTIYLPVKLNNTILPKVGVFIPNRFHLNTAINLIVYFHGMITKKENLDCKTYPNEFSEGGIEYYWNTPYFKCLREDLFASGQQVILIAPTLMPDVGKKGTTSDSYGNLDKAGKFDFLINETLRLLIERNELPPDAQVQNIILSGHSGGGLPMQKILNTENSLKKNISECWGFECLYFGTSIWERWLAKNQNSYFHHFRRESKFTAPTKNLIKYKPKFVDVHDGTDHCRIVTEKWRQAINSSRALQGDKSPTSSATNRSLSGIFSLLSGLPGLATLPATFITALLGGFQNENDLTNLIFSARHPELGGRKLKGSDLQSLKDEWVSILKMIVRPAILRLKEAASKTSSSTSIKIQPSPTTPILNSPSDDKFSLKEWKLATIKILIARAGDKKRGTSVEIKEAPAVFLLEIIGMARDMAMKNKENALADQLDPSTWFKKFTRITFLGRSLKDEQYLHLEMAKLLKGIEAEMVKKYGGNAKSVGDMLLNNSSEGISGSRLVSSTATFSMHMFGLAVDVNYRGNPFIESRDISMLNIVLKNASLLMNKPTLLYKRGSKLNSAQLFDSVQIIDSMLEKYFSLLDVPADLEQLVRTSSSSEWHGLSIVDAKAKIQKNLDNLASYLARGSKENKNYFKKHAILDFDKRFVVQMEESGLNWGAHYGDMMHFDMREIGVGKYIEKARVTYKNKAEKLAERLFKEKKYGSHPFNYFD
jgi:hypothetical protein